MPRSDASQNQLTAHMEEGVTSTNVRQESIAKPLAFGCAFYEASDVYDVEESGHFAEIAKKKLYSNKKIEN